jgi:hypothetical protein
MFLKIQIDKPINAQLLFEELNALNVGSLLIDGEDGYIEVSTDNPGAVVQAYQNHDHTATSQEEQLTTIRRDKAATMRQQAEGLDWENMTPAQAIVVLRHVVTYLLARLDSEHE